MGSAGQSPCGNLGALKQPFADKARLASCADNQMIVQRDRQAVSCLFDEFGHFYIAGRRAGITRGMVVHEDDGAGIEF